MVHSGQTIGGSDPIAFAAYGFLVIYMANKPFTAITLIEDTTGGAMGRALDLRSTDRGFIFYSGQKLCNNLGQVVHIYVPLSPSSITLGPMLVKEYGKLLPF